MKNWFKLFYFFGLFSLSILHASASPPCATQCTTLTITEEITGIYEVITVNDPPCVGQFTYIASARKGICDPSGEAYFEYTLENVIYDGTSGFYLDCERAYLINLAQLHLLGRILEIFGNTPDPTLDIPLNNIYIKVPICWQYFPPPNSQAGWRACPVNDYCCFGYGTFLRKTEDIYFNGHLDVSYSPDPIFECLDEPYTYTDCNRYSCDSLEAQYPSYVPFPRDVMLDQTSSLSNTTIIPNPVTDEYELSFVSEELGSIYLIISDNLGNTIENIEFNKESYEFILPLSSEELVTGTYFFKLIKDDLVISEGAFTVVK